jgi:hypothetical protein
MPREAELFQQTDGRPAEAFWLMLEYGGNIPESWIERAKESRKAKERVLAKRLKQGDLSVVVLVKEWETYYRKECFYRGIRALLDLKRHGKTQW